MRVTPPTINPTRFFWLIMSLYGPFGLFGCNPAILLALFGLGIEHPSWYPWNP